MYLPSLKLLGQSVLELSVAQGYGRLTFPPTDKNGENWYMIKNNHFTVFTYIQYSAGTKQHTKSPNAKLAVKAEILPKTILFVDSEKRSAISVG